jgi:hypothetical protein
MVKNGTYESKELRHFDNETMVTEPQHMYLANCGFENDVFDFELLAFFPLNQKSVVRDMCHVILTQSKYFTIYCARKRHGNKCF